MQLIIFTKDDEELPDLSQYKDLRFRHIRFSSTDLDDLLLIAQYRIISYPTSIIINDKGSILLKKKGFISLTYLDEIYKLVHE